MGNSHPYYKVVQALARETEGEAFGQWCQGCHMPQQVMNGQQDLPKGSHMFERGGASLIAAHKAGEPVVEEGTGCVLCHRITRLEDAGGNSAFTVNLKDRESYVFEDAAGGSLQHWLAERQINARPPCTRLLTRRISTATQPCASRATTSLPRHRRQHSQHLGRVGELQLRQGRGSRQAAHLHRLPHEPGAGQRRRRRWPASPPKTAP